MFSWKYVTYKSCKPYKPDIKRAKVIKVYDGDTVTLGTRHHVRYSCRLAGIDTAEIRTKNPEEKAKAIESRDFLRSIIMDEVVDVEVISLDKYGRILAKLRYNGQDISQLMLDQGGAVPYDGGRKLSVIWEKMPVKAKYIPAKKKKKFLCCCLTG